MKTKLTRISKRTLAIVLTVLMMFSMMIVGTVTASAWNVSNNTKIYFDNTNTGWTGNIYFLIGNGNGHQAFKLSNITGTNLYYYNLPVWDGYGVYAFAATSSTWSTGSFINGTTVDTQRKKGNYTALIGDGGTKTPDTSGYDLTGNRLFVPASSYNNCSLTASSLASYSALNYTQTTGVRVDSGSGYKSEASPALIKISTYQISGNGTSTTSSSTISQGSSTSVATSAARTASVDYSVSNIQSGYEFKGWYSDSGTLISELTSYTRTKITAAHTVYARFKKSQSTCESVTLTREPSGTVYKGTECTFTADAKNPESGVTYNFYLDGRSVQSGSSNTYTHTFTDTSTHSIYVQVEKSGYTAVKSTTLSLTPKDNQVSATKNVVYYIDLHDNKPTTNPTIKFSSGNAFYLTKQGTSTVYSATVSTPYKYDAVTGNENTAIADIPATVSCNGCEYPVTIGKKAITTGEAWLESIGDLKKDTIATTTTTATNSSNTKRIYVRKKNNNDWYGNWVDVYLFYKKSNGDYSGVTWGSTNSSQKMNYIGLSNNYYEYYLDVPSDVKYYKPYGKKSGDSTTYEIGGMPDHDIDLGNTLSLNDDDNNKWSYSTVTAPSISEYYKTVTIQKGDSYSIAPKSHTGTLTYTISTGSTHISHTSSTSSTITATSAGTATVTITAKGTYGDTVSVTTTITVKEPATLGSLKAMSYKSVSSKFSVENGTFNDNAISTVLTGSEATGNKDATLYNCGIITQSGNEYTVKYAENEAETGYNLLRLTVTVSASPNDGYGFDGWYVGGEKSSQYKNENDAITVDGNDYILKYTEQTKWKVNIIYKYDLYNDSIMTRYDEDNAENDVHKEYEVKDIEFVGSEITDGGYTEILIHNAPNLLNDYYEYHLVSAPQSVEEPDGYVVSTDNAQNTCTITANLKKTVRTYTVYLNGDIRRAGLTYQEPFTIKSGEVSNFNSNQNLIWSDDGKDVATGTSYSFRVTGDMNITARENTTGETFNGKSIIAHRSFDVNTAMKQLVHNFYIADFYNDDLGSYVDFVGGGVLYFAMDKTPGKPTKPTKATGAVDETGEAIKGEIEKVVERVAGGGKDYYNDQLNVTDNDTNIVCRYLKYDKHKELFKYSDELQAYQYIYSPSFLNDDQYKNYSLRVYSYFIYEDLDESTYIISVSDDYADAKLYEVGK